MEKARYNTELYSNLRAHLNNVKPSNFWGSHQCHYNEWAEALNDEEVFHFAESVQSLYEKVFCDTCFKWISSVSSLSSDYECPCKKLTY